MELYYLNISQFTPQVTFLPSFFLSFFFWGGAGGAPHLPPRYKTGARMCHERAEGNVSVVDVDAAMN